MSDDDLREAYDRQTENTIVGTSFWLDELNRREALRIERSALDVAHQSHRETQTMRRLTLVILAATIVNVALVAVTMLDLT